MLSNPLLFVSTLLTGTKHIQQDLSVLTRSKTTLTGLVTVEKVISRELFFPRSPRLWSWGQWPRLLPGAAHQADVLFQVAGKEEPTEETCTDGLNPRC